MRDRFRDEGSGTACRVQDMLIQWIRDQFPYDALRQPVWGVVFAELASLLGWYNGFVQNGGNIGRSLLPVEPGHTTRKRPE